MQLSVERIPEFVGLPSGKPGQLIKLPKLLLSCLVLTYDCKQFELRVLKLENKKIVSLS
jgi:hypothetical protein